MAKDCSSDFILLLPRRTLSVKEEFAVDAISRRARINPVSFRAQVDRPILIKVGGRWDGGAKIARFAEENAPEPSRG